MFFSATFILSDFNPYLLSYCPFGKTNNKYHLTRYLTGMIPNDLYIWNFTRHCVFLNKREVLSRFFGKSNIFKYVSTCQTRSSDFWTLCARLCVFSLYISHLLLSSQQASIAIWTILISKSWWWLLKLKRLTSTLHHNTFTYLDYVFLLPSYCRILIHIYFHIYIYIYIKYKLIK